MRYPSRTPYAVRTAVDLYVRRRKTNACRAAALAWLGLTGMVVLAFMLLDRFGEWVVWLRAAGPWLVCFSAALTALWMMYVVVRRWRPFSVAIHLDQAFPENRDRWATSLDLAERMEKGEHVGARRAVERLFLETEEKTSPQSAPRTVSRRAVMCGLVLVALAGAGFFFLHGSGYFDLPLLWKRFWAPRANLPRDSMVCVSIIEANGRALPPGAELIPPIPEGETFSLKVALQRRTGGFSLLGRPRMTPLPPGPDGGRIQPCLEIYDPGGCRVAELVRSGPFWSYVQRNLTMPLSLRIRAGDALTEKLRQDILSRIKMVRVLHSIRFPGYARLPEVKDIPLPEDRLSLLEGTRVTVEVECNEPYTSLEAVFDVLERQAVPGAQDESLADAWTDKRFGRFERKVAGAEKEEVQRHRRVLKVRRRKDNTAQFRLDVEDSGILRIRATGANGLPSLERVCAVEAVKDRPPRIVVSGLEPDTYIIPGEAVAYDYRAEDDLAVADLIMNWDVAGGAISETLAGEEYIHSEHFGEKTVSGSEILQRMNYYVYGTSPFRFRLTAIDSKGQESFTECYRIHIVSNDFISRFEDGWEYLNKLESRCQSYLNHLKGLNNQLDIIARVAGDRTRWPPEQEEVLKTYAARAGGMHGPDPRTRALYRFGGFPYRLRRSIGLLVAVERLTATSAEFTRTVQTIRMSEDLPAAIKEARALIAEQSALAQTWSKAISAEKARFAPEKVLQQARRVQQRMAELEAVRANQELYRRNLDFHAGKLDSLLAEAEGLTARMPELAPLLSAVKAARAQNDARPIVRSLGPLVAFLSQRSEPPSAELMALAARMTEGQGADGRRSERTRAALAEIVAARGDETISLPMAHMQLSAAWMQDSFKGGGALLEARAHPVDVWLAVEQLGRDIRGFRANVLCGRYKLDPNRQYDDEAELREKALVLKKMMSCCPELAVAGKEVVPLLEAVAGAGFGRVVSDAAKDGYRELAAALEMLARPGLVACQAQVQAHLGTLAGEMHELAARYDELAAEIRREQDRARAEGEPQTPAQWNVPYGRARELQAQAEALEAAYRMALLSLMQSRMLTQDGPGEWAFWEPLHGVQLAMTVMALDAYERISLRFQWVTPAGGELGLERYSVIAKNACELADLLRRYAGLVERLSRGESVDHDFGPLMKRSQTVDHLDGLRAEFEDLVPALSSSPGAGQMAELGRRLFGSVLGRAAIGEELSIRIMCERKRLESAGAEDPGGLIAPLQGIQRAVAMCEGERSIASVDSLLADLAANREPPGRPALSRRLAVLKNDLEEELVLLRSMLHLLPISAVRRGNVRHQRPHEFWPIEGKIAHYDLRWLRRMRDAELALARELVELAFPAFYGSRSPDGARMQYARLVELRARQIAHERRRNRGISFLQEAAGPRLRLPKHIAEEFFRARNRKSPEYFQNLTEDYYDALWRELAQ